MPAPRYDRWFLASGAGFTLCVAFSALSDGQRRDAVVLGVGTALLTIFVGGLWLELRRRDEALATIAAVAGIALVPLYGVITELHLTVSSREREIWPWMFVVSFVQPVLLLAAGLAFRPSARAVSLALVPAQLVLAIVIALQERDAAGSDLSAASFALWVGAVAVAGALRSEAF